MREEDGPAPLRIVNAVLVHRGGAAWRVMDIYIYIYIYVNVFINCIYVI